MKENRELSTDRKGRPAPPPVDPVELDRLIKAYADLELMDRGKFRDALTENILDPDPAETAAFRSDQLAPLSLAAARWLQENTKQVLNNRSRNKDQQRAAAIFQREINREATILQAIVDGNSARAGRPPNERNPRKRAMQRLVDENLKGDVPQGRFREIFEEEKEKDRIAIAEEEAAREERRRAAKERKRARGASRP